MAVIAVYYLFKLSQIVFIAYWNVLITVENGSYVAPLCPSVQAASDWGCCFSSCLLYKLIWSETFALLGAKRDEMLADTSWRSSPLLTAGALVEPGALPHSLESAKYHLTVFFFFILTERRRAWDVKRRNTVVCRQASYPKNSTTAG